MYKVQNQLQKRSCRLRPPPVPIDDGFGELDEDFGRLDAFDASEAETPDEAEAEEAVDEEDTAAEEPAADEEPAAEEPAAEEPSADEEAPAASGLRGAATSTAPYGLGDDDRDATW